MKPSRLAVATNLLLDLADQVADVLDAVDIIDERLPDAEWVVTPGVLDDLAYIADFGLSQSVSKSAKRSIQ